jgi:hypothetical protein
MEMTDGMFWLHDHLGFSLLALAFWWIILAQSLVITAREGSNSSESAQTMQEIKTNNQIILKKINEIHEHVC